MPCSLLMHRWALIALSGLACAAASAQSTSPPAGAASRQGAETVSPAKPPGGNTSNKGAVPSTAASGAVDPNTGSTPGMPPGATSARGDKAATPKGKGAASAPGGAASR